MDGIIYVVNKVHDAVLCDDITLHNFVSVDCDGAVWKHIDHHIVLNYVAYSPFLQTGDVFVSKSGIDLVIDVLPDGTITVNGDKIVKSDIITKNGVMHFVDNVNYPVHFEARSVC